MDVLRSMRIVQYRDDRAEANTVNDLENYDDRMSGTISARIENAVAGDSDRVRITHIITEQFANAWSQKLCYQRRSGQLIFV